jgi:hypothetical protein
MKRLWTKEEDCILTELVQVHGKQWGLIAAQLPQRTPSQVSARWEKCLDPMIQKGPFSVDEDQLIINYVRQHGPHNWPHIASVLPHRSAKQCRERWFNHLDPAVIKAEWTPEEDELIFQQVEAQGTKWSLIAKLFPGRSDNAIKNRWNSSLSRRIEMDDRGQRFLRPDSGKRRSRPRERSVPDLSAELRPIRTGGSAPPIIPLSSIVLPTPVFPALETLMLSPSALMRLTPEGLESPTRAFPLFLSPSGSSADASFK